MIISSITLDILNNFSRINQGLLFKSGSEIRTISVLKNIYAIASIPDNFPKEFAVYDLNELLSSLSLVQGCEIEFADNSLIMKKGSEEIIYMFSSPAVVVSPGEKSIKMPSVDQQFSLSKEVIEKIIKVSSSLKLRDLKIDNKGITLFNKNSTGNKYNIKINIEGSEIISFLRVENLKILPLDYVVEIAENALSRFISKNEEYKLDYYIALESE